MKAIEILRNASHLLQMRGLKPMRQQRPNGIQGSHLLQMRGLKHCYRQREASNESRIFYRCVD